MGKLVINTHLVTPEKAEALMELCPFGAISYTDGVLDISSGCKMCKMCVRKGRGLIDFVEEVTEIDKSLWKGIVAINTDSAAPIFDVAHYSSVGDVNLMVPSAMKMHPAKDIAEAILHHGQTAGTRGQHHCHS